MEAARREVARSMKNAQLTLHSTVLLLSIGSWLLLFTVELGAVASEGEEVFHPSRLGAYITSAGFGVVTCLLLILWCLGASGRTSYTSVMPAEEKDAEATSRCSIIFWHYAIHGILVLATICWICIHSVNLQHQQVWRGILTLYSLLSLTLICFSQRRAVGRGFGDGAPMVFLRRSKGEDEGQYQKPSTRSSEQSKSPNCKPERWKPLFQDPNFGGEVPQGTKPLNSRRSKRNEWRSFVFEEQAEAILSPTSGVKSGLTLPMTFQRNLHKLRGIARRGADSDQGSVRRSSFASSDQGDGSHPASPTFPRVQRTQSQPSVSSGFSDVSDCIATPSSPSLVRGISKDSRRISKDSRRDSRHSAESESAMSDVSEMGHVVIQSTALASVCEEESSNHLATVEERSEVSVPSRFISSADRATVGRSVPGLDTLEPGSGAPVGSLPIPSPAASGHPFSLDSARTVNSDCVEGILAELKVEDNGNGHP